MLRLYLDEDAMRRSLLAALRSGGIDVRSALEERALGKTDPEQLEIATSLGRVLYSYNVRDFIQIHSEWVKQGRNHTGIVVEPNRQRSVGEQARCLIRLADTLSPDEMANRFEFLGAWANPD